MARRSKKPEPAPTVDTARRLAELRFHRLPRKGEAQFTDENDHNPLIKRDCPSCHGNGLMCRGTSSEGNHVAMTLPCTACGGKGASRRVVWYFEHDSGVTISAQVDIHGWVTCPGCGIRFKTTDKHRWTGRRHVTCGQLVDLKSPT